MEFVHIFYTHTLYLYNMYVRTSNMLYVYMCVCVCKRIDITGSSSLRGAHRSGFQYILNVHDPSRHETPKNDSIL